MSSNQQKFQVRKGPGGDAASHALGDALNRWFSDYGPADIYQNCGNCLHMNREGPAFCKLYNTTPPVDVILAGCPSHQDDDEIPF
jgi:hypothetical protein